MLRTWVFAAATGVSAMLPAVWTFWRASQLDSRVGTDPADHGRGLVTGQQCGSATAVSEVEPRSSAGKYPDSGQHVS